MIRTISPVRGNSDCISSIWWPTSDFGKECVWNDAISSLSSTGRPSESISSLTLEASHDGSARRSSPTHSSYTLKFVPWKKRSNGGVATWAISGHEKSYLSAGKINPSRPNEAWCCNLSTASTIRRSVQSGSPYSWPSNIGLLAPLRVKL